MIPKALGVALAVGLVLVPSAALAEQWRRATGTDYADDFIDVDSIERRGNVVRYWRETRYFDIQTLSTGLRFDTMAILYEADCVDRSHRALRTSIRLNGRTMFGFEDGDEAEIERVRPGSIGEGVLNAVCDDNWES